MTAHVAANDQPAVSQRLGQAPQQLHFYLRTLRLIWGATPRLTLAWLGLLLVQGLLPIATVYLTKQVVDSLVNAVGSGLRWSVVQPLVVQAALMGGVLLAAEVVQGILEWVRAAQSEHVEDHLTDLIQRQSASVDLAFYEAPEYYDHLQRAQSDASARSLALLESTGGLAQNGVTLVGVAVLLLPYGPGLPLALLSGTLPALLVALRFNRQHHRWWRKTTTDRRWVQYYNAMLTTGHVAAELRLFDLGDYFRLAYQTLRRRLRQERLQLIRRQGWSRLAAGGFSLVVFGLAISWVGWRALQGQFGLGDLALFYQALNRGQGLMRVLFGNLSQIYANSLFLSDLYEFLGLRPLIVDPPEPVSRLPVRADGVRFQGVTFSYPGSAAPALNDFSLHFPAGRISAIVGENGAGKSTLVKLLCRFYDPAAGGVTLDGVDIRELPVADLRRRITVLFQLPVPYQDTAAKNIAMGTPGLAASAAAIEQAARGAGAHAIIAGLPKGYETLLGKLFPEGVELSVGEWQRVALARAFLRQADIVVLDEPTSFMDSWAEASWMERFHQLVKGKTVILITHRFTTARHADHIHVMKAGQVLESGSHDELLELGGAYAQSWQAQMLGQPAQHLVALDARTSV
jgi:ATP-binding cassette subfamily B protein